MSLDLSSAEHVSRLLGSRLDGNTGDRARGLVDVCVNARLGAFLIFLVLPLILICGVQVDSEFEAFVLLAAAVSNGTLLRYRKVRPV
ncbi:hypothetical protein [Streptomyces malaysiensis]|uniref:Mg2 transporter protein CorA family protein n=1 Tax=Streptomyces malaysiensis TaxID=92644 RepID=A0A7X5X562_STRMQ|nr:hypothetical protein [Streptomyces malaysiensis]NIY65636.1 Mg2 transporter protein CorA family protein [Streptomyces malaysiensis]